MITLASLLHPAHTLPVPTVTTSPPQRIKWCPSPYLHSINNVVWSWVSTPRFAARLPESTGPSSHIQKQYISVCRPKTGSHLATRCLCYLETLFFQGSGSFVCNFIFCSFYHAATNYGVKTSQVKQREHAEKAHGDHLQDKDRPVSSSNGIIQ